MIQSTRNGLLISLLLLLIVNQSSAFNLDVVNYIRHEGQNGSMFGFSVALHQEAQRSWVIVGAPKADTSQYQQGVVQGGAVYRCDISDDNRCQVIHFDSNGNNFNERNEQIDTKSGQWFGATVASAGIDGPLVACAPRYVYHQHQPKKVERIEPVGTCFIAKDNFNTYQEFSPCRTMYWGYHRQGSCQAGLSAALNKNGDRLFVGAPGSWYWQGQVYSINTDAVFPYKPPRYGQFGDGGQMYSYGLNNPKDKVYSTKESSSKEDDSYLGYSSVTGDFTGDGIQGVAVGMPRGGGLLGKVLVFSWNLTNHANITGEQIGAYFGYSLCSIDVDGDKLEDLIIGAPMYTEPNNEGKYENGRVYIAYQNKFNKFKEVETREGIMSKGRFGLALSALGDINLDGYGDFAVGAPYDGVDGRGAVYIYHGSSAGPLAKPSQVIYAEDVIGTDHLSTFGFSLSGGIDLDGNQYPDLVVGAYNSNRALVFKSRAVAVMEASSVFEADNKMISLDNKNCTTLKDNKEVTCTIMRSCLKYNGVNLPATIDIEISWVLDSKKQRTPRMFFLNDEGKNIRNQTMRLNRGKSACTTETVYIADGIRDKLTPLEVEMKYNMRTASSSYTTSTVSRRRRAALEPVLDQNKGTVQRDSINIMKNCGSDNICIPDLRLEVKTVDEYLLGSKEPLAIDVLISNFGEDAFEAGFFMNIPSGLDFKRAERIGDIKDTPFTCTPPSIYTNNTLKCDIGNPFPARKVVNFRVTLDPSRKGGISPNYVFYMESNSTNVEAEGTSDDNRIAKDIGINVETDLSISGNSLPEDFHYNVSNYKAYENATHEADLGPQVVHIYDIRNNGTSSIDEIEVFINWPVETLDGEPLMYLLNQPETMGNVQCDPAQFVNEFRLQTDRSLEQKSYLDKNRVPVRNDFVSWSSSQRRQYKKKGTGAAAGGAGGAGGSISYDENRKNLDFEDNLESTGDSSYSHREQQGSYYQNNNGGAAGGAGNRNTVNSQTSYTETHHGAANSGEEKMNKNWKQGSSTNFNQGSNSNTNFNQGANSNTNFNQGSNSNSNSNFHQGSSFNTNQNSNQGSTFNNNQNFNQGSTTGGIRKWVAGSTGETEEEYYKRTQGFDSSNSEDSAFRVGANGGNTNGNNREWSYEEKWNSSSINGGPVVTHVSSKNSSSHRGEDGKVRVSETSTEQVVLAGRFAGNWDESQDSTRNRQQSGSQTNFNNERNGGGYRQENSYRGSQTGTQTAQGGRGFQTSSFDLGVLNRGNADEDLRRHGHSSSTRVNGGNLAGGATSGSSSVNTGSSFNSRTSGSSSTGNSGGSLSGNSGSSSSGSSSYSNGGGGSSSSSNFETHSSGSRTGGSNSGTAGRQYTYSSTNQNDGSNGGFYTDDGEYEDQYEDYEQNSQSNSQRSGGNPTGYQSSSANYVHSSRTGSGLNAGHESVNQKFMLYPTKRTTRDIKNLDLGSDTLCKATKCVNVRCVVGPLDKNGGALIALRTRLVAHTLNKISSENEVKLSTMAVGRITKLPYIGASPNQPIKSHEVFVTAIPDPVPKSDSVPLWIVVLAACAGALILLLLVYLLYKCGFFKRNRPSGSTQERQPLNRNGNYHGDEHL
ncbi:unnamed protein product [Diamesa tonsa]